MRGSGRMSTAANGVSSDCRAATVRAEKPHAGASGVPFMNRITLCSEIASAIASRIGLDSPAGAAEGAGCAGDIGSSLVGLVLDMGAPGSGGCRGLRRGGVPAGRILVGGLLRDLRLQRERVDRTADLGAEDLVDEAVLLDPAAPREGRRGHRRAEVVAAAGVVLDLGAGARDRRLDALPDLLC